MSAAETQMDLDRITHPLRLARGSHQPGSGNGCAMNAISYINGDEHITDFPTCSDRSLAIVVQSCNELHRQAARGDMPAIAAWDAADRAARAAARPASPTSNAAGAFAVRAAYESITLVNLRQYQSTLDAAIAFAVRAHTRAAEDPAGSRVVELARQAIRSWRHLAGLNNSAKEATSVDNRRKVVSQAEFGLAQ